MNSNEQQSSPRTLKDYAGLTARGFAMGASDIVPGVSGGTMALILGIYEELIQSVRSVLNPEAIKLLLRFKIKQALDLLPWKFLVSVALGIFLAIFSMSYALEWVLEHYPSLLWAFFFGLVAASILMIGRKIKRWHVMPILSIIVGAVGAYTVVGLVPMETPNTWWFWFLSGVIAISAMVLPGISGAFILVLLGKYKGLLSAVTNQDFFTLFLVVAGAGVGIVSVAQVLGWLFKRYHDMTVAFLAGMLIGSLRKVWPWKESLDSVQNVLPSSFTWEVVLAVVLLVAGFALISGLNLWAARRETPTA